MTGGVQRGVSPLDRDYLTSVADGDEEFIEELAHSYLNSSKKIIVELCDAVEQADAHRLQQAAHALKGSSRAIGANPVGDVFEQLEVRGRDEQLDDVATLLEDAVSRYHMLVNYMQSIWPVQHGVA